MMNLKRIKKGYGMRRVRAFALSMSLLLALFLPGTVFAEEERIVLTIGDNTYREAPRMSGDFELLVYHHDIVVSGLRKAQYRNREFELHPGDCVLVYTDGVPEAVNTAGEMFGEKRMTETLNECPDAEPETLVRHVHEAVDRFAGDEEQFDDITMLSLKYNGAQRQK